MRITRISLLLLLFLLPLAGGQPGVAALAIFAVLTAFGWLGWALEHPALVTGPVPLRVPFAAMMAVTLLATTTSVYLPASVLGIWQLFILIGAVLLACLPAWTRSELFSGALAFAAGVLAGMLAGWVRWIEWVVVQGDTVFRLQSTWVNANYYAAFLLISIPVLAVLARHAPRGRPLFMATAALALVTLMMTQSRGAVLALLLVLLTCIPAWLWMERKLTARTARLALISCLLFVGLALISPMGKRLLDPEVRARQLHSQLFRYHTWQGAWRMAMANPWLGTGPHTFPSAYGRYHEMGYTRNAHSLYLQAAAETGWPGLLALLSFFAGIAGMAVRVIRASPATGEERALRIALAHGVLASATGLLLHGVMDSVWSLPGLQLGLGLQSILLWKLTSRQTAQPAHRVLGPGMAALLLTVSAMLAPGVFAQYAAEQARMHVSGDAGDAIRERERLYRRAIRFAPTTTHYLREASLYLPPNEGRGHLQRTIRLERTNAANYLYLGHLYYRHTRNYPRALEAYRQAEAHQRHLFPAIFGQAQASYAMGDLTTCRDALDRILRLEHSTFDDVHPVEVPEPWYAQAWYARATIARQSGDGATARAGFEATLRSVETFQTDFTRESEAWAAFSGNTDHLRMLLLRFLAHDQLASLLEASDPGAAARHAAHVKAVDRDLLDQFQHTPFPGAE